MQTTRKERRSALVETRCFTVGALAGLAVLLGTACGEPECPPGYQKMNRVCKHLDASSSVDEAGALVEEDGGRSDSMVASDDSGVAVDGGSARDLDAATLTPADAAGQETSVGVTNDASSSDAGMSGDAAVADSGATDAGSDAATTCGAGYVMKNAGCQDIDECSLGTAACHPTAPCENQPGTYTCKCRVGFSGGGTNGIACAPRIAVGDNHYCVTTSDARVMCWGGNDSGQLGDGTMTARSTAAYVESLDGVAAVDVGRNFSCALLSDGTVKCWGANTSFQLGVDVVTARPRPVLVTGLSEVVAISVGTDYACAIRRDRSVVCWGNNTGGLVDGKTSFQPTPAPGISNAMSLDCAGDNCAVGTDGTLRCWGNGTTGLQYGTTPVAPFSSSSAVSVTAGYFVSCGYNTTGDIFCWGTPALRGTTDSIIAGGPNFVHNTQRPVSLSIGVYHVCYAAESGDVQCWGVSETPSTLPGVQAAALSSFNNTMCAVLKDGTVRCWAVSSGKSPASLDVPAVDLW